MTANEQPDAERGNARAAEAARTAAALAKGAISGGAAGFAKAAATSLMRSRRGRRILLATIATLIAIPALVVGGGVFVVASITSSYQAKHRTLQHDAERSSSVTDEEIATSLRRTQGTIVPQTIYAAITKTTGGDVDLDRLRQTMRDAGISADNNDPAAGAVTTPGGGLRMGDSNGDRALASKTQARYLTALTTYGLTDAQARTVFTTARQWTLGAANVCAADSSTIDAPDDASAASAGSSGTAALTAEQTQNAKVIIGVAKSVFGSGAAGRRAAIVGLATALQESGLRNIDYGDRDSLGLFQQRASWGSAQQRTDPPYAAGKFFQALQRVSGWQQMEVTVAAQAVQISGFPEAYAKWEPTATSTTSTLWDASPQVPVPAAAGGTGTGGGEPASGESDAPASNSSAGGATCATSDAGTVGEVSGTVRQAARALLPSIQSSQLTFLDHSANGPAAQIRAAAAGTSQPNCQVHLGALQAIQVAVTTFGSVQVSSLNRACSGAISGSNFGTSPHSANGGGRAVDFSAFAGRATNGSDQNAVKFLQALSAYAPGGNVLGTGQVQCRRAAGASLTLPGVRQFNDYCNHVHVDFGNVGDHALKGAS